MIYPMADIILMSDPVVYAVPIDECEEPLVDIRDHADLLLDSRVADRTGGFAHLRAGVLERVLHAATLLPRGLRLMHVEGYRRPTTQQRIFDEYSAGLGRTHPGWTEAQIRVAASRYISPPDNAPHCAGAAIDLTLSTHGGRELDMGCELNASPEESHGACYTQATNITAEAAANRAILAEALTAAGLVNYPTEWWHWSYGDRYWALLTNASAAIYGPRDHGVA